MSKQSYAKLANCIRAMSKGKQSTYIGEMASADSVRINDLTLEKEDFLIAEHLINASFLEPLKAGDIVFIIQAETQGGEEGIFVILERLVSL